MSGGDEEDRDRLPDERRGIARVLPVALTEDVGVGGMIVGDKGMSGAVVNEEPTDASMETGGAVGT